MLSGLEGQVDMEDMVLAITVAGGVLALTSLLGLTLACARPSSCAYSLSASLYFATSLPALAAGGFVVAYCLVFRDEADRMVQLYWRCLQSTEPPHADGVGRTAWDAAAAVYQNITLTAALLGSSELLLLLGLLAAAARVGWATVSARLLLLANTGGALLGAGLAALAGGLLARAATPFDVALLCVAVAILLVSAVGLCGARRDARLVLRLYAGLMGALSLASAGCVLLLYQLGPAGLASNAFVREHWKHVEQVYPLSQRAFEEILAHHWTKLMIAGVLVSFVLCLVTLAAAILRRSLEAAAEEPAEAEETAGLMGDDDDEMA